MKSRHRLLACTLPLLLLAGCGDSAQDHFLAAQKAYAGEDYAGARRELLAALRKEPKDPALLSLMVASLLRLGDADGAQTAIERLRRTNFAGPEMARYEAEAALLAGRPKEAVALLGEDNHPAAWRIRAAALLQQDDTTGALAAFNSGIAAGDDLLLINDFARFAVASQDQATARAMLGKLHVLAPGALETLMLGGQLAFQRRDMPAALAQFRKAASAYPSRFEPLLAQAEVFEALDKLDIAAKLAEAAAELGPTEQAVQEVQLRLLSVRGNWEKIRSILQGDDANLDPASARGMTYAEALLRLGHAEQARMTFNRAVLLMPQNRYARLMLGETQIAIGDAAAAVDTLEPLTRGLMTNPRELELAVKAAKLSGYEDVAVWEARMNSPVFRAQVALSGQAQGASAREDWPAAIAAYQELLGHGPDGEVLKRMAFALSKAGRHADAIANADKALAIDPENPEYQHMAGLVRLNAGSDPAGAVRLLRMAADAVPGNAGFAAQLAKAEAAAS